MGLTRRGPSRSRPSGWEKWTLNPIGWSTKHPARRGARRKSVPPARLFATRPSSTRRTARRLSSKAKPCEADSAQMFGRPLVALCHTSGPFVRLPQPTPLNNILGPPPRKCPKPVPLGNRSPWAKDAHESRPPGRTSTTSANALVSPRKPMPRRLGAAPLRKMAYPVPQWLRTHIRSSG